MTSPPTKQTESERRRAGQRLHDRLSVQRDVRLCWENRVLLARAVDISRFGLLVETERAIAPGTVVSVQTNAAPIGRACVRHCTPKGTKYRIGLHLPDRVLREL